MLGLEDFMTIQALVKRGVHLCDIAEQLGVHPRTVRRALQRGGAPQRRGGRRGSLLDPYRPVVDQLLADGVKHGGDPPRAPSEGLRRLDG